MIKYYLDLIDKEGKTINPPTIMSFEFPVQNKQIIYFVDANKKENKYKVKEIRRYTKIINEKDKEDVGIEKGLPRIIAKKIS